MLRAYGPDCDGSLLHGTSGVIPAGATWLDLEEPTREEDRLVERFLGVAVPTREDMVEIEPSSRLYERSGAIFLTMSVLYGVKEGRPSSEPITFVLTENRLVTVRYVTPKPLIAFSAEARRNPELTRDAPTVMARLLDAVIDRLADELEDMGGEIESISNQVFDRGEPGQRRIPAHRLELLLSRIGRVQTLLTKVRETAVSTHRLLSFLAGTDRMHENGTARMRDQLASLTADTQALIDHSGFLSGNLIFLLDASLGLISIEQNAAMKLFSWAALIFLPPTLVAGVYGMNFEHMPELDWLYGYPMALGMILASAVMPLAILKWRGWI